MNIEELKVLRDQLERDMEAELSRLLNKFYGETCVSPSAISVYMHDVTTLTDPRPVRWVTRVQCDLSI